MFPLMNTKAEEKEKDEIENLNLSDNVEVNNYTATQKFFSEFIGSFFLLLVGSGIGVFTQGDIVPVVLANGFVITAMIYCFGRISGAHFNPSVSIPMFLRKKIRLDELIYYSAAQYSGGFLGSLFVALCNRGRFQWLSSTQIGSFLKNENSELDAWSYIGAFLSELLLTFGLVTVVFASTNKKNNFKNLTGLIIGVTLIMLIFTGFHLSGASMNPVRSLPPAIYEAIFGGNTTAIKQIWIYFIGPISGGILASLVPLHYV